MAFGGVLGRNVPGRFELGRIGADDGAAYLAIQAAITATGFKETFGAASLVSTVAVAPTGYRVHFGASALQMAVARTAVGVRVRVGAASLALNAARTATAYAEYMGQASLASAVAISPLGLIYWSDAATVTGDGVVSATELFLGDPRFVLVGALTLMVGTDGVVVTSP